MSKRYRYSRDGNCWALRTAVEKTLICATALALLLVLVLAVLVILQLRKHPPQAYTCITPTCLSEASQIIQRVDPAINPCHDFYKFACGNLLKRAHGDEKLGSFFVIQDKAQRQIQEMYSEPVRDGDHRMVRVAKNLYRACMNESAIAADGLSTIKEVLRVMGGWPVVEGAAWDEAKFWWVPASYKLRELGYFYASFMSVTLEADPENENKFIFKVSMPDVEDLTFDKQEWVVDVAIAFEADEGRALTEVAEMYDFVLDMRRVSHSRRNDEAPRRFTVSEFQKKHNFMNWREFINNIIGPAVRISSQDRVLFPPGQSLHAWYRFISKTPKRIQANYMMWRAIEDTILYMPELHSQRTTRKFLGAALEKQETRPEFCIRQIRKRFSPSPIDIMYVQRYLPTEKRRQIKEVIKNIKSELAGLLGKAGWMGASEKQQAMERVNGLNEVIGAPEDYFEDGVLDDLDFDMNELDNQTFLGLLAQVNRNHQSYMYSQIYSSKLEFKITQWKLQTASFIGDYSRDDNVINLPATIFQDIIFDGLRPNYLNYGSMGTMMGHHLPYVFGEPANILDMGRNVTEIWASPSRNLFERNRECFVKQIEALNSKYLYMIDSMLHQSLALKVSYAAYNRWAKYLNQREELMAVDYTPRQLFWISAASYFCQPLNPHSTILRSSEERDIFSFLVSVPMLNDQNFANDFNCPLGSKMNPVDKCEIFV